MHQAHINIYGAPTTVHGPCVAAVAHQVDGHSGGDPQQVLSALDAGNIGGDLVHRVDGSPIYLITNEALSIQARPEIGSASSHRPQQRVAIRGESLQHVSTALGEPEDGDPGALRHRGQISGRALQPANNRERIAMQGVDQQDVDRAAGRRRLAVGVDPERELWRSRFRDRDLCAELPKAADGLWLAVLLDAEVGLFEAMHRIAVGVGDLNVYNDLARGDVEGRNAGLRDALRRRRGELVNGGGVCLRGACNEGWQGEDQAKCDQTSRAELHRSILSNLAA